jgi:5-formyltetrahydrofolate cyclo-ligase
MGFITNIFGLNSSKSNESIDSEKEKLRTYIKQRKKNISETQKSIEAENVFEKIEKLPEFADAKTILLYWSMPDELPTHNFIVKWCQKKQILLPVVKGENMLIKPFSSRKELKKSSYGVWEPDAQKEFLASIDLIIAPGIAFDRSKNRLGRGKGYYDRYFIKSSITKIGVGFDFQLLNKVPANHYDIKLDKIITSSITIQ